MDVNAEVLDREPKGREASGAHHVPGLASNRGAHDRELVAITRAVSEIVSVRPPDPSCDDGQIARRIETRNLQAKRSGTRGARILPVKK